jgi:APA family basic amino acid/polyamine antiporter
VSYRRSQDLDLTSTVKHAVPAPAVDREAEYEAVLVAFDERGYSRSVMGTASRLAATRRRGIHILVTITVPTSSPIDADMPEQEAAAQSALEEAKIHGGRRVTGRWAKVRAGQTARRILDEARALQAEAIVMPIGSGGVFSPTLQTVLRERPCRVILEFAPDEPVRPARAAA